MVERADCFNIQTCAGTGWRERPTGTAREQSGNGVLWQGGWTRGGRSIRQVATPTYGSTRGQVEMKADTRGGQDKRGTIAPAAILHVCRVQYIVAGPFPLEEPVQPYLQYLRRTSYCTRHGLSSALSLGNDCTWSTGISLTSLLSVSGSAKCPAQRRTYSIHGPGPDTSLAWCGAGAMFRL